MGTIPEECIEAPVPAEDFLPEAPAASVEREEVPSAELPEAAGSAVHPAAAAHPGGPARAAAVQAVFPDDQICSTGGASSRVIL